MLRAGEAYYRMTIVGEHVYAMLVTPTTAHGRQARGHCQSSSPTRSVRCAIPSRRSRTASASPIRSTSRFRTSSTPSCSGRSRHRSCRVKHLIFEPDGGAAALPPNLLVMDQASVDAYQARAAAGDDADFDFRGIALARPRPRHQHVRQPPLLRAAAHARRHRRAARTISASARTRPPSASAEGLIPAAADRDCILPLSSWNNPISAKELQTAARHRPQV